MSDLVEIRELYGMDKEALTSSRSVAESFDKLHKDVIRAIEKYKNMNLTSAKLRRLNDMFIESNYVDEKGERRKEYLITRDGFSLLVMGFTGEKALIWKLKYIEAFNKMEQKIIKERYKTQYLSTFTGFSHIVDVLYKAQKRGKPEFYRTLKLFKDYLPDDILEAYANVFEEEA